MNNDLEKRLAQLSNTREGLACIAHMLERGDFPNPDEAREVKAWMHKESRRRHRAFLRTPEGSAIRQADYAKYSIGIALLALLVSIAALLRTFI
jgi:hypothetical protein